MFKTTLLFQHKPNQQRDDIWTVLCFKPNYYVIYRSLTHAASAHKLQKNLVILLTWCVFQDKGSQTFQAVTCKINIFELGTPTLTSTWNCRHYIQFDSVPDTLSLPEFGNHTVPGSKGTGNITLSLEVETDIAQWNTVESSGPNKELSDLFFIKLMQNYIYHLPLLI